MLWKEVLVDWENGIPLKYPKQVKGRFQWNTSVLKPGGETEFKQVFRTNDELPSVQNKKEFADHFLKSKNEHVIFFPNLSKDTMLIVPMPVRGKNYATLLDFSKNAPEIQQQQFWKTVAKIAKAFAEEKGKVWISVHGLGVSYTHVRISTSPKYYFNNELKVD